MTHPAEVKAMALGMILTGYRVNSIARMLHIPRQTVSRWNTHLGEILDECFQEEGKHPSLPELGRRMGLNGTKKPV
jgi:transposase-like protein